MKKQKIHKIVLIFFALLVTENVFSQQENKFIKAPQIIYKNNLPVFVRNCWHNLDIEKDTLAGTSLIRAYEELLKNKSGNEIIVAVIDTDLDIHN